MAAPRLGAGLVAATDCGQRREVAAGAGTEFVNGAGNRFADAPAQGHATRRRGGRAAHANPLRADGLDQADRHAPAMRVVNLFAVERNAVGGTTGAARLARAQTALPPFHGRLCTADRLRRRGAVLREFPATPPSPGEGVTMVRELRSLRNLACAVFGPARRTALTAPAGRATRQRRRSGRWPGWSGSTPRRCRRRLPSARSAARRWTRRRRSRR